MISIINVININITSMFLSVRGLHFAIGRPLSEICFEIWGALLAGRGWGPQKVCGTPVPSGIAVL